MKRMIEFLVPIVFFSVIANAQDGWVWQNPLPQGNELLDVFVFNQDAAIAVGRAGTIIKTTDGGNNWTFKNGNTDETLRSVWFIDSSTGWIVGENEIRKTTDGGENWITQEAPFDWDPNEPWIIPEFFRLMSVHFTDASYGWAVDWDGRIIHTSDGGENWIEQTSPTEEWLWSVWFVDRNHGWAAGGDWDVAVLLRTSNGGTDWTLQPGMPTYSGDAVGLRDIQFPDANNGWIVGGDDLTLKTTNGGTTWNPIDWSPWTTHYTHPNSVYFTDVNRGWIVGQYILHTIDGGDSWSNQGYVSNLLDAYGSVHLSDVNYGYIAGTGNKLLKTTDEGANWNSITTGVTVPLHSVYFENESIGWVVGDEGAILNSTNGGMNWILQDNGISSSEDALFKSVFFTNENTGWAAGLKYMSNSPIVKTTNGGTSWVLQSSGTSKTLESVCFADVNNGWVVGESGIILNTDDGGNIWQEQTSPTSNRLESVYAIDENNVWAVGGSYQVSTVIYTTNGGTNWNGKDVGTTEWLESVYFINNTTGWIVGYDTILKTDDGGDIWTPQTLPDWGMSLVSIHFADENNGYAAGGSGEMVRTTDGGANWTEEACGTTNNVHSVYCTNANSCWVVGDNGTVLNKRGQTSVEEIKIADSSIPDKFILLQNYPNPFNPSTKIHFNLPTSSFVNLQVFNILGKEIETLIKGEKQAGEYEIIWNAKGLPSGIYFYRLEARDFIDTKKMIYQK